MFAKLVKSTVFIAAVILFTASVQANDYVEGKEILMLTYMAFYASGEIVKSQGIKISNPESGK